jgi:Arm DNA-binding domain/Phage integrase, N-terminal SAM-like domain
MKLTDNLLRQLPAPRQNKRIYYDDAVKGFSRRVSSTGVRAFILTYRRKSDGHQRRLTIGSFPDWSVVAAREQARRLKREVDSGSDPLGQQEALRDAPTIADLCERFEQDYVPRKRPSTQRVYKQQIAADIRPALGKTKVAGLTHADVDKWHHKLSARGPTPRQPLACGPDMTSTEVQRFHETDRAKSHGPHPGEARSAFSRDGGRLDRACGRPSRRPLRGLLRTR